MPESRFYVKPLLGYPQPRALWAFAVDELIYLYFIGIRNPYFCLSYQ